MPEDEVGLLSYPRHKNQLKILKTNLRLETVKLLGKRLVTLVSAMISWI